MIKVDAHSYDQQDAAGTIAALGAWWEQLTLGRTTPVGFEDLLAAQSAALTDMLEVDATDASLETIDRLAQTASDLIRKGADVPGCFRSRCTCCKTLASPCEQQERCLTPITGWLLN